MPKINFKLSDGDKHDKLLILLNPNYTEEGNWTMDSCILEIYDDYALIRNYAENIFERIAYKKDDENDTVEILSRKKCYFMDITEDEKVTVETLRKLNGENYELISENLINADINANSCIELNTKIEELNGTITTLNTEVETSNIKVSEAVTEVEGIKEKYNLAIVEVVSEKEKVSTLTEELTSLKVYKKSIEDQQKDAVIAEYTDKISEEVIKTYKDKIDEYTAEELDMRLAYEFKKTNTSVFNKNSEGGFLPKDNTGFTGVDEILARYKK